MRSAASNLLQLDRDLEPVLYRRYISAAVTDTHLDHLRKTADKIEAAFSKKSNILEIGGGAGYLMEQLSKRGYDNLHIIDPSEQVSLSGSYKLVRNYFPMGLREIGIKFDLIIGQHFLEHSSDPVNVLKSAASLLTDSGEIWMEVPNIKDAALQDAGTWLRVIYALHSAYYDEFSLRKLGEQAGLIVNFMEKVDHYGKSLVVGYSANDRGRVSAEVVNYPAAEMRAVEEAIKKYFDTLASFAEKLPTGLVFWGASEGCLSMMGGCMRVGFVPSYICDSNDRLRGMYASGMQSPIYSPSDVREKIEGVVFHTLANARSVAAKAKHIFHNSAIAYIPNFGSIPVRNLF